MIKHYSIYLLVILSTPKGGNLLDSLHGNYCYPDCKKFNSIYEVDKIIELNSGVVKKYKIEVGQILNIEMI